ncbi:uncharacterized protein [Ptychodera flava]|uniref:uncharacterized protein n=1 Tax=Ptychodera flava TaxID=63121 RepID=UPI003969BF4B
MKNLRRDLKAELKDVRKEVANINDSVASLRENHRDLLEENKQLRQRIERLEAGCDRLRGQGGRNNLIFEGISEKTNGNESWEECEDKVRKMLKDELKIEDAHNESVIGIERAHRLPNSQAGNYPRGIIVKFLSYKTRSLVLQKGRTMLKDSNFKIKEDFSPLVREKRRKLIPFLREAIAAGKRATLVYDKLLIDGERFKFNEETHNIVKL